MESKCIINSNGTKRWKLVDDKLHRVDGPAIIFTDGTEHWYLNDKLHREDGPAVIDNNNGYITWFFNGIYYDLDSHRKMPLVLFLNYIRWKYKKNGK